MQENSCIRCRNFHAQQFLPPAGHRANLHRPRVTPSRDPGKAAERSASRPWRATSWTPASTPPTRPWPIPRSAQTPRLIQRAGSHPWIFRQSSMRRSWSRPEPGGQGARGLPPTGTSRVAHGFGLRGPRAAGGLRPLGRPRDKNAASPFQRSRGLASGGNGCALSRRSSFRRPVGLGHTGTRLNSRARTPLEDRRRSQLLPEHGSADH